MAAERGAARPATRAAEGGEHGQKSDDAILRARIEAISACMTMWADQAQLLRRAQAEFEAEAASYAEMADILVEADNLVRED